MMNVDLTAYLDDLGRIKTWPKKMNKKLEILDYLATKFELNRDYNEKEVNEIIDQNHTFNDYFLLRRGLIDYKLLSRTPNGARYWKNETLTK